MTSLDCVVRPTEEQLTRYLLEAEADFGMGGLSDGLYADYVRAVVEKIFNEGRADAVSGVRIEGLR